MGERWFCDEELGEMSRPTMERAIEAIERGDSEEAKRLCEEMKHESQFMHDLLVDGVAGLISFVKEELGDDGVERGLDLQPRAELEAAGRDDRRDRPQAGREGAGRDLARPLDQRRGPEARARSRSARTTRSSPSR